VQAAVRLRQLAKLDGPENAQIAVFDRLWRSIHLLRILGIAAVSRWPNVEVVDTGREVRVAAEIPGVKETL